MDMQLKLRKLYAYYKSSIHSPPLCRRLHLLPDCDDQARVPVLVLCTPLACRFDDSIHVLVVLVYMPLS